MRINREPGPDPALRPQQLVFRKPCNCPPPQPQVLGHLSQGYGSQGTAVF